jgi:hypothetical protein
MVVKQVLICAAAVGLAGAVQATSIPDATGDYLATYTGPHQADLDVTSLSVSFNNATDNFLIQSTMAGTINPASAGFYVIGVNTGTGLFAPFGSIGAGNVRFNQAITVQKDGSAKIGATSLAPGSVMIGGNALSLIVPLSLLPSTGWDAGHYAFNIWPRSGTVGGLATISDFAPNNSDLSAAPEPAAWAMMVSGFGLIGTALRGRRSVRLRFA